MKKLEITTPSAYWEKKTQAMIIKDVTEEIKTEACQPTNRPYIKGVIRAEQEEKNILILSHVSPVKRLDGKRASYRVEYRWLRNADDVHSVMGRDFSYWEKKELTKALAGHCLFDCFRLF